MRSIVVGTGHGRTYFSCTERGHRLLPERVHTRTSWILGSGSQWATSLGLRHVCYFLFVSVAILWFRVPLVFVYAGSLHDEQAQHYSHITLIPFLSLYLVYIRRAAIFAMVEWAPSLGSILMAIGGAVLFVADNPADGQMASLSPAMLSLIMICLGSFLFCYGPKAFRTASFALGLLVFMVPFPTILLNIVVGFLQRSSAEATALLFSVLGVPVFRDGFVFSLSNFAIHVAEECSGIRSALALFIIALVAGHFLLRSLWGKIGLVAIVVPLAIIKNAFRIVGLSLLANYVDPTFITDSVLHRSGGIPLFLLSLVVLLSLVWLLRSFEKRFGYYSSDGLPTKG